MTGLAGLSPPRPGPAAPPLPLAAERSEETGGGDRQAAAGHAHPIRRHRQELPGAPGADRRAARRGADRADPGAGRGVPERPLRRGGAEDPRHGAPGAMMRPSLETEYMAATFPPCVIRLLTICIRSPPMLDRRDGSIYEVSRLLSLTPVPPILYAKGHGGATIPNTIAVAMVFPIRSTASTRCTSAGGVMPERRFSMQITGT